MTSPAQAYTDASSIIERETGQRVVGNDPGEHAR